MAFKRCSIGSKCAKKISTAPLHHHHQPEPLRQGRSLRQILTLPSECCSRNQDSSDQATFFQSTIVQFLWACVNCILRVLFLADRSGTRCGLLLLEPICFRVQVLCVQRWYSADLGCNEWLFELLLPFYHLSPVCPFSSDLWHQQGIFIHTTAAHWIFFLFRTILCKP